MTPRSASLDADRLRALAHPLRLQLLALLRTTGAATASGLAQRLGTSSGLTSYHLRQLAGAGLVTEDETRGTTRERWWEAAHEMSTHHRSEVPEDAAELSLWLEYEGHRALDTEHSTWLVERSTWADEWTDAADQSDYAFRLTPVELRSLLAAVHEALQAELVRTVDRRDGREPTPDEAAHVRLHLLAFPVHEIAGVRLDDP